jgi:hypothetical protein
MLDETTRSAILRLREEGHGTRRIAAALGVARSSVRAVLTEGNAAPPRAARVEKAEAHRDEILALYVSYKGNLVRVHEELVHAGAKLSYQALTAFCRRHSIGTVPPTPVGRYVFAPGQEMQHDTSPHVLPLRDKDMRVETASLVLCHSTMLYFQFYPRFNRFACKCFLHDALTSFGATCATCMIDNTHVVVLRGSGASMSRCPRCKRSANAMASPSAPTKSATRTGRPTSRGRSTSSSATSSQGGASRTSTTPTARRSSGARR